MNTEPLPAPRSAIPHKSEAWQSQPREGPPPWTFYLASVLYGTALVFNYESLSYWWDYIGFQYLPLPATTTAVLIGLAAIPSLFLPHRPRNMREFAAWTLNFTVFVPGMLIPPLQAYLLGTEAYFLFGLLLFSAIGFNFLIRLEAKPFSLPVLPSEFFWGGLLGVYALLNLAIFFVFGTSLSLAGVEDVYTQRSAAIAAAGSTAIIYGIGNLTGAINPFLIAYGMRYQKWGIFGLGLASQLLAYSSLAGKIVLVSTLFVIGAVFLMDKVGRFIGWRLVAVFLASAVLGLVILPIYVPSGGFWSQLISLMFMRTLYLPGVLIGAYGDFFTTFEVTYLSHSILGRFFFEYPYGTLSVGQVVGAYVTPGGGYNYNNYIATFIAGDGIASIGLLGVPIAVALGWLVLHFMDAVAGKADRQIVLAAGLPFVMLLSNSSIFTSLLTGGGGMLVVILGLWGASRASSGNSSA